MTERGCPSCGGRLTHVYHDDGFYRCRDCHRIVWPERDELLEMNAARRDFWRDVQDAELNLEARQRADSAALQAWVKGAA